MSKVGSVETNCLISQLKNIPRARYSHLEISFVFVIIHKCIIQTLLFDRHQLIVQHFTLIDNSVKRNVFENYLRVHMLLINSWMKHVGDV